MEAPAEQITEQTATRRPGQYKPGQSGNPRGRLSAKAKAAAVEAERQVEVERLTADLRRELTVAECVLVDQLASLIVLDRRQRAEGKVSTEPARLIARLLRQLGVDFESHRKKQQRRPMSDAMLASSPLMERARARRATLTVVGTETAPGEQNAPTVPDRGEAGHPDGDARP